MFLTLINKITFPCRRLRGAFGSDVAGVKKIPPNSGIHGCLSQSRAAYIRPVFNLRRLLSGKRGGCIVDPGRKFLVDGVQCQSVVADEFETVDESTGGLFFLYLL